MVKHVSEVKLGRHEGHGVDGKDAKQRKLDRQHLVCTRDLNGDAHTELFVLVLWRNLLVLPDKETIAGGQDCSVRLELGPDLERAMTLNVPQSGVELEIRLEVTREKELDFHCV